MKRSAAVIIGMIMCCTAFIGCGQASQNTELADRLSDINGAVAEQEAAEEDGTQEEADTPEDPEESGAEESSANKGEVPSLIMHRYNDDDWSNEGPLPLIKHRVSFVTLDKDQETTYKGLAASLVDVMNEILSEEQKAWDDESDTIGEDNEINYDEGWLTYVRRADPTVVTLLRENSAISTFDGDIYCDYTAHSFHTDTGKEIEFSEVVKDEEAFFDIAIPKIDDYIQYASQNIYATDIESDTDLLRSDIKEYMENGNCVWTLDPQGVTLWISGYMMLPCPISATVLFSEDAGGEIFADEFVTDPAGEWIMQIPEYVDSYCDVDDSGREVYVAAHAVDDMRESEGSEEWYIKGLYASVDGKDQVFDPISPGGTSYYDTFLIHRNHKTILLENHDEYDAYHINTFTLNDDGVNMIDATDVGLACSDDETYRYLDTYLPYYIPTDMSDIKIAVNPGTEGEYTDTASVDEDGHVSYPGKGE